MLHVILMKKEQQIATWIFMMLAELKKKYGFSIKNLIVISKNFGLIRFLNEQYELLHYYDNDYIIEDVIRYIEEQGGNIHELSGTA